jgi:hypothetical protein
MSDQEDRTQEACIPEKLRDTQDLQARGPSRRRAFKRLAAALALLTGMAVIGGLLLQIRAHVPRTESVARVGRTLPAIPIADESGQVLDVAKVALGTKTVIVFYSTACDVCQKELPNLRPFPAALRLIMVNEGASSSEEIDRLGLPYTRHFYDRDRIFERLSLHPGLPTILLVDEQGVLRDALVGAHSADVVRERSTKFAGTGTRPD